MARLIVDEDWKILRAAERYDVSWKTAKKWADRYAADGAQDRAPALEACLGPVEIAELLAMHSSTVYTVLVRCRLNRFAHIDRATGEPIHRYQHERPGDLIHMDVKKLGRVPDGGG